MLQDRTCWGGVDSSCKPCFVWKEKKKDDKSQSLTLSQTEAPQRGLVCTLFLCSAARTMNQGTKPKHPETAWHAFTIQKLGKESLYWMFSGSPFASPLCTAATFSLPSLGPEGQEWGFQTLHKAFEKASSMLNSIPFYLFKHLRFSKLKSLFVAMARNDLGPGQDLYAPIVLKRLKRHFEASGFTRHTPV